eukprot:6471406-Amphidinium_carterae.1
MGPLCRQILPHMPVDLSPRRGLSRSCQQRVQRRIARQKAVNRAVDALNWLQTGREEVAPIAEDCPLHDELMRHVSEFDVVPISSQEAVDSLLRGRTGYEVDAAPPCVAPYRADKVSLPTEKVGSSLLEDLLPTEAKALLDGFEEKMLKPREEVWQEMDHGEDTRSHWDPTLLRDNEAYSQFVAKLIELNILGLTVEPLETNGVFFVKKKNGTLRMICDCRRANKHLRNPPSVSMSTPETFTTLEVTPGSEVFTSTVDIADCFHRLKIPYCLGRLFSLRPLPAALLGVCTLQGKILGPRSLVWPHLQVLPMGCSWSLYYAQAAVEESVRIALRGLPFTLLGNARQGMQISDDHPAVFVYVDNVGVMAVSEGSANAMMDRIVDTLERQQLKTHERCLASRDTEAL